MKIYGTTIFLIFFSQFLMAWPGDIDCEKWVVNPLHVQVSTVQISGETLYRFTTNNSCGFQSASTDFPVRPIKDALISDFFRNNGSQIISPITETKKRSQETYRFATDQNISNKIELSSQISLSIDPKYIEIDNTLSSTVIKKADAPYAGLEGLSFQHYCFQESAGWCVGISSFTLLWKPLDGQNPEQMITMVKETIIPQLFLKTLGLYFQFVFRAVNHR